MVALRDPADLPQSPRRTFAIGGRVAKKDVLQPVDADVRRAAKTFLRTARHGALATLDPGSGMPMASRVSLASDSAGNPLFLISQLSGHFGALEADARASVLLGEPGKGDPLAHPAQRHLQAESDGDNQRREEQRSRHVAANGRGGPNRPP